MTAAQWERAEEIFLQALEREPAARAAFLNTACASDDSLRTLAERLLAGHQGAVSFLQDSAPASPASESLEIGRALSHFRILEKLGEGGMGIVYRATDIELRRPVALKVIRPSLPPALQPDRRLVREARAASALNHPNIAQVYEIGEDGGIRFIAMEYIQGRTLEALIRDSTLGPANVARLGAQMAAGLAEAHAHGMVHLDLKPSNVMVNSRGEIKLLDFGLARLASRTDKDWLATGGTASAGCGVLMGTIPYMSPEQLLGLDVDHRSDIFSLGLVLYELAAGRKAFRGEPIEVISRILAAAPEPLESRALDRTVRRCLEKLPERRYQSAADLERDLERLGTGNGAVRQRRSGPLSAGAIAALLTISAAAAVLVWNGRTADGGAKIEAPRIGSLMPGSPRISERSRLLANPLREADRSSMISNPAA